MTVEVRPAGGPVRSGWAGLVWFIKGVLGENAYQQYLDHHVRSGCSAAPMSEKQFWRARSDWQQSNPQGRCC